MSSAAVTTVVEVICPSVGELTEKPKRNVPCTVEGCDKLLATTAALKMHVIKRHGIYKNKSERVMFSKCPQSHNQVVKKQYYCPIEGCNRHKLGGSPFPYLWPLKQHYQQVHGERKHFCRKCNFPFAFELQRDKHEKNCGTSHTCSCGVPFTTRQALCMHAMRKKHDLPSDKQNDRPTEKQQGRKTSQKNGKSPSVTVNRILTIPVPASQAGNMPQLIVPSQPLQVVKEGVTAGGQPPKSQPRAKRFLLPKPSILSVARAAALHPETTQIVTINKGLVTSIPVSVAPCQPIPRPNRTLATQTQARLGRLGKQGASPREPVYPVLQPKKEGIQGRPMFRDLGINTLLNDSINCQTQTVVQQNSAHTQTPGDVIMQEALISAHIETPSQQQQQQQQQQQDFCQQQLQEGIPAFNRYAQTSQPSYMGAAGCLPNVMNRMTPVATEQPQDTMQSQSQFSTNSTSSCDVQTDRWLSSLVQVNHQGTLTDIVGVPTQTDLSFFDFLNLSNSETQTVISRSDLEEPSATESASTQTSKELATATHAETSIQTSTAQNPDPDVEKLAVQSTMQTQTNFYSAYLDAFLLNESQSQTSPGKILSEDVDVPSCCQQTQTLSSSTPQRDHQQTQTALPDLSLGSGDFLSLDMYTQTARRGLSEDNSNSSLQTQTDPFLEYSLSSMQTQTMADFDLDAFDYQSISVQTDLHVFDNPAGRFNNRTQVQTQTSSNWRVAANEQNMSARNVQTDTRSGIE